ncbi:MAG TPA: MFS transporter [Fimbriimonas sp.]
MNYRDVLSIRSFRNLWLGQAVSQLGDAFYFVIFMFMVERITGSTKMVGYVGVAETVPYLLFGMYAGTLADRIDRRKIMLWGDIFCGAALLLFAASLYLNPKPPVWTFLVLPFFLSSVRVFFFPAKNAAIPSLVSGDRLLTANALSMATQNMMPMISLSLSASVLAVIYDRSPQVFFLVAVLINAMSFLISAVFIARMPEVRPERISEEKRPWHDMLDGLRYLRHRRVLIVLMALSGSMNLLLAPFFIVYIVINKQWFGGKPASLAWFEFAFFAGMVLCSFFVGKFRIDRPGRSFAWGLSVVGLAIVAMAATPYFWPFFLLQFVCGLAIPFADIPMATYLQTTTPDAFRGRVNAVMTMVRAGIMPLGLWLGGLVVDRVGPIWMFVIMGSGMALSALAGLVDPHFRNARMDEASPAEAGDQPSLAVA